MSIKIQFFFLSIIISSLANSADSINKWKWGNTTADPSNLFDVVDPKSKLVTDPAYSDMDPASILLSDLLNAQDPKSVRIVEVIKKEFLVSKTVEVIEGSQSKTVRKTTKSIKESFDSDGNTVTKTYDVFTDIKTIPITTVTTEVTTEVTTYGDGSITKEVIGSKVTSRIGEKIIGKIPKGEDLISTKITANPKDIWSTKKEVKKRVSRDPTTSSTHVDEKVESMDENGSTVIDTYRIYTDTTTVPVVMETTTITTQHTLWTDGKTTTKDTTKTKDSPLSSTVSTKNRKVHVNRRVAPNIVSINNTQETATKKMRGAPSIDSDCTTRDKSYRSNDKTTTITTYKTCVNIVTTPITTVKTTTTKRNTLWTDGSTTNEVINVHKEELTINCITKNTTEDIVGSRIINYYQLTLEKGGDVLRGYISNLGADPETMSDPELSDLAALICQKLKVQGIGFTPNPIFYDSSHNWNNPSGFEKLYDLIEKCLKS